MPTFTSEGPTYHYRTLQAIIKEHTGTDPLELVPRIEVIQFPAEALEDLDASSTEAKNPHLDLPLELLQNILHRMNLIDRVQLALCSKGLARTARRHNLLWTNITDRSGMGEIFPYFTRFDSLSFRDKTIQTSVDASLGIFGYSLGYHGRGDAVFDTFCTYCGWERQYLERIGFDILKLSCAGSG